jgi:putative adenylate-forming enzyme
MNTVMAPDALVTGWHFARTRWRLNFHSREQLENWQQRRIQRFIRDVLPRAPRYRGNAVSSLADLPTMDKSVMMDEFTAHNTRGVNLEQALAVGLRAEEERNFSPMLGDLTVGLSSGTSGNRGVFLASHSERLRWAGIMLARAVPEKLLGHIWQPWKPRLRIAFFLRANSNLYTTLNTRRVAFTFYDLLEGADAAISQLNKEMPHVLVGPPSLLCALAAEVRANRLHIQPEHVISVADVLERRDSNVVQDAFGIAPHQLYQATEGFLGYSCESGCLHLNECFIHIEPEWLDTKQTRFQPIITDFSRESQLIVRYRLNDVLQVRERPCECGRAELAIQAIEGRADEVVWLPSVQTGESVAIYPDQIRRAMFLAGDIVQEYEVRQSGMHLEIGMLTGGEDLIARQRVQVQLDKLWQTLAVQNPTCKFSEWRKPPVGAKRRRITVDRLPSGLQCRF